MSVLKVTFEQVSAIAHPEYYNGDRPAVTPDQVPEAHWSRTERQGDGVVSHYEGLQRLIREGELIRDVRLFESGDPEWHEIQPPA